ncbi:MAG: outer membrane protein, partial [Hyphomicrobiaceae bacterium]
QPGWGTSRGTDMTIRKAALGVSAALAAMAFLFSPAAQAQSWTGCYVSALGGAAVTDTEVSAGTVAIDGIGGQGAAGGLGAGCDFQTAAIGQGIVVGAWASYLWQDADFKVSSGGTTLFRAGLNEIWAVGGRAGLSVGDRTLVYGLAGYSGAQGESSVLALPKVQGPVVGAGIETKFTPAVSFKIEYRASLYESEAVASLPGLSVDPTNHQVLVGFSFRFGGPPATPPTPRATGTLK